MDIKEALSTVNAESRKPACYIEDQEAFIMGEKLSCNPHKADVVRGLQWREGYLNAAKIGRNANNMRSDMARFPV